MANRLNAAWMIIQGMTESYLRKTDPSNTPTMKIPKNDMGSPCMAENIRADIMTVRVLLQIRFRRVITIPRNRNSSVNPVTREIAIIVRGRFFITSLFKIVSWYLKNCSGQGISAVKNVMTGFIQ